MHFSYSRVILRIILLLGVTSLCSIGCIEDETAMAPMGPDAQPRRYVNQNALDATLVPVRTPGAMGNVYFTRIEETIPGAGTFEPTFYIHISEENARDWPFLQWRALTPEGAVDLAHTFQNVTWTVHPGQSDEYDIPLPSGAGQYYQAMNRQVPAGWHRVSFTYGAPNANRTLEFSPHTYSNANLKIGWADLSGTSVNVRATVDPDVEAQVFFKGGAYRNASESEFAYIDNVSVDGFLLYRQGFDQGQFNYPLGRFNADPHTLTFSYVASGANPAYLWFGVNEQSFDPSGVKTEWENLQFVYNGAMHTGDYDAWNEGVAFAQGGSLVHGVRPPPVRRGTSFTIVLRDQSISTPNRNATVEVFKEGNTTPLNWTTTRDPDGDYFGGVFTTIGYAYRVRETWTIDVPDDAPVGKYIVKVRNPWGFEISTGVLFYVIHNPYDAVESGLLTKAELETNGYDEDEDGMGMFDRYGTDDDANRDHFTADIDKRTDSNWDVKTRLTAAFRRTEGLTAYSMLDYAMTSTDGAADEMQSMQRLLRLTSQSFYYTHRNDIDNASQLLNLEIYPGDFSMTLDNAEAASHTGYLGEIQAGVMCYDYAFILASIARSAGIVTRVVSSDGIVGLGDHRFTEAFMPEIPYHGGSLTAAGNHPADVDPWYAFDATNPFFVEGYYDGLTWLTHSEAIAPRSMFGRASLEVRAVDNVPPTLPWMRTNDVDWILNLTGGPVDYIEHTPDLVVDVEDEYYNGNEYWLTAGGATGYIGFSDKDLYRVSRASTGGAVSLRVNRLPSPETDVLTPVLCIAPVNASEPSMPEMCVNPGDTVALPATGEYYVAVFNGTPNPTWEYCPECRRMRGDSIQYELVPVYDDICQGATPVDFGVPGTNVTVTNDACLQVTQYPEWWGTRTLQLQNTAPGSYPVPLTWSNCPGIGGADAISYDWQNVLLNPVNDTCTTLIKLNGDGNSNFTLRYYAN